MLEYYSASIPLIELSHKWTWIIFIILNTKIGIWIFIQPTIDVNLQYNFCDVLTLQYTRFCTELCPLLIPANIQTTYPEQILYIVPPGKCFLLCIRRWKETTLMTTHAQNSQISICQSQNFRPVYIPLKREISSFPKEVVCFN